MISGFYAGSFDPPTRGHIDIIARAMAFCERLVIGIGVHPDKTPLFSADERAELLTLCLAPLREKSGCAVEIMAYEGLLVDVAAKHKSTCIIRGLRTASDFEYEAQMGAMNHKLNPAIETLYLAANPQTAFISSTLVRQIGAMQGELSAFVPAEILPQVKKKYNYA